MSHPTDLHGQTFGKLTAIRLLAKRNKRGWAMWLVRCTCGARRTVAGTNLIRGVTKSCGAPTCKYNVMACLCGCGATYNRRIGMPAYFLPGHRGGPGGRWRPEDDRLLGELYGTTSIEDLCKALNRPRPAIRWRACWLGITYGRRSERESLSKAAVRVGLDRAKLKLVLEMAGIAAGRAGKTGPNIRVNRTDVDRVLEAPP